MAETKKSPDRPGKVYKCHSGIKFESVICIICEDVYHANDFQRRKAGLKIGDTLAICKTHTELLKLLHINLNSEDITSIDKDHVLTSDVIELLAHVKNYARCEMIMNEQSCENKIKDINKA